MHNGGDLALFIIGGLCLLCFGVGYVLGFAKGKQ